MILHHTINPLMCYFRNEDEALHLALGDASLSRWEPLGVVLRSTVGLRCIRDPFVARGHDSLFHLVFTNGWSSPHIGYASSHDLVRWSGITLLPLFRAKHKALDAWAPEFIIDWDTGEYFLYWSSRAEDFHFRIFCCRTRDFANFTEPSVLFDPGHAVIDANIARQKHGFLMSYKDERETIKNVRVAKSNKIDGGFAFMGGKLMSPEEAEGPTVLKRGNHYVMMYDNYQKNKLAVARSIDMFNWTDHRFIDAPPDARHPSIVELTNGEARDLRLKLAGS